MESGEKLISLARKPQVVVALGSFIIALFLFYYYTKDYNIPGTGILASTIGGSTATIEYFGYILGCINYTENQVKTMVKRTKYWWTSIICVAIIVAELTGYVAFGGASNAFYQFCEVNLRSVVTRAASALTTLLLISCCYRALKWRSLSASFAMLAMLIALLYSVPLGTAIWPGLTQIGLWTNTYVSAGTSRALTIVSAVGSVILTVRVLFGYEWGMYGVRQEAKGGKRVGS